MGWWESGEDILGDGPADTVGEILDEMAGQNEREKGRKPTLQELLDALATALSRRPPAFLCDAPTSGTVALTAVLEESGEMLQSQEEAGEPALVEPWRRALEEIALEYEESEMVRKPRLSEVLATFCFVMNGSPGRYLASEGRIGRISGRWR
jgi:hypothetical protein